MSGSRRSRAESAQLKSEIVAEYLCGDTVAAIAERHSVSQLYVWSVRKRAEVPGRVRGRRPISPERRRQILEAYLSGEKLDWIEVAFGVSRTTIYKWTDHRRVPESSRPRRVPKYGYRKK